MTPSHYRLQLFVATGNAAFWLTTFWALAYRQAWVDMVAAMMERGR